ncbi:MAG: YcaO-like family protein [Gammaproteobacteria bacterium]|nr:YcaO-like family protein [Gammaproteobacteria bacterium]
MKAELAAQRALTELCQLISVEEKNTQAFNFSMVKSALHLYPSKTNFAANYFHSKNCVQDKSANQDESNQDILQDVLSLTEHLNHLGFEALALDYSQPNIGINACKVFAHGLCHYTPLISSNQVTKKVLRDKSRLKALPYIKHFISQSLGFSLSPYLE